MLKEWLSRFDTVHRAETREEREAVYRFRYRVYFEEFGRELGSPDHERKWVTDADDEKPYTTILYTGTPDKITGTVRLRHWRSGTVPRHDFDELSMGRFPDIAERNTAEIGRLMVRRSMRGKLVIAALLRASYEVLAGEEESDLVFCYCSPGLVRYYRQLAMRPYGGRLIAAPDGLMVPLVSVVSDHGYFRRQRSLFAPMVKRYFGPGKRRPLDLEPYRAIFADGATGIELEPERIRGQVRDALGRDDLARRRSFLGALPEETVDELAGGGLIVDVEAEALVTRKGFSERELYVVLEGHFETASGEDGAEPGDYRASMARGELFGEDAFLHQDGRRIASVKARTDGRLLVLRGRAVEKLVKRQPEIEPSVVGPMRQVMAERMGVAWALPAGSVG